jgi:hypothetical protein
MNPNHPIGILNTSIMTADGEFSLCTISADDARELINGTEILSAVGHESTAQALTEILGREIPGGEQYRIQFVQQVGQKALVFKLRGRPPEGKILTREEIEDYGYDLKLMVRTS